MKKYIPIIIALIVYTISILPKMFLPSDKESSKAMQFLTEVSEKPSESPKVYEFSELPVLYNGRVKPFDTIARNMLRLVADTETVYHKSDKKGKMKVPPSIWLLDALSGHPRAAKYRVFRMHNLELLEKLNIKFSVKDHYRFSLEQLAERIEINDPQMGLQEVSRREYIKLEADYAYRMPKNMHTVYQQAVLLTNERISAYEQLVGSCQPIDSEGKDRLALYNELSGYIGNNTIRPIPTIHAEWENMFVAELTRIDNHDSDKCWNSMRSLLDAWKLGEYGKFNQSLADFQESSQEVISKAREYLQQKSDSIKAEKDKRISQIGDLSGKEYEGKMESILTWQYNNEKYIDKQSDLWGSAVGKCGFERFYNNWDPFYSSLVLYIITAIASCVGLLIRKKGVWTFAVTGLIFAFTVHCFAVWARWYISGYPPVTNLYSSAVFISWGVASAAIVLELYFKRYFALISGAVASACCLIVAQNLLGGEDSMGMMRAVLDTKFWLTTHVITITLGYTATFLAGAIAAAWCIGKVIKKITPEADVEFARAIYGLICYGLLLSFVGTVLGGLWADDSWGRFWGWDPKENGALMIVIWNAVILHARIGGLVSIRGMAGLAIFGNIVTCFSWFGVNLLGIGLHSYGFTDSGFAWVMFFTIANMLLILLCLLPLTPWQKVNESTRVIKAQKPS